MPRFRPIDDDTAKIGVGGLDLDVAMLRSQGWSFVEINALWDELSTVCRKATQAFNARHGRTVQCGDCECWTYPGKPCHLCAADEKP